MARSWCEITDEGINGVAKVKAAMWMRAIAVDMKDICILDGSLDHSGDLTFEEVETKPTYQCNRQGMGTRFTGRVASRECFKWPKFSAAKHLPLRSGIVVS